MRDHIKCKNCGNIIIYKYHIPKIALEGGFCSKKCYKQHDNLTYTHDLESRKPKRNILKEYHMFEPRNEAEVVALFSKLHFRLGFKFIKTIRSAFPDCICIDKHGKEIKIEFEYKSHSFLVHGHDSKECDLIVCWEHDWNECQTNVMILKDFIYSDKKTYKTLFDF